MRIFTLAALFAAITLVTSAGLLADDEDHPFGPRPDKGAPLDDPFATPFGTEAQKDAPSDKDPINDQVGELPADTLGVVPQDEPLVIGDNPFGNLPDDVFQLRPVVARADVPLPNAAVKPEDKGGDSLEIKLDINGDNNITDIEVQAVLEGILRDSKSRTARGEKIREKFDTNKDGKVDLLEAAKVIVEERIATDVGAARTAESFASLDTNGDGQIDPTEFLKIAESLGIPPQAASGVLKYRFSKLDKDGDSKISLTEAILSSESITSGFGRGGTSRSDEEAMTRAQEVLTELDRDGNNEISKREAARNADLRNLFAQIDTDSNEVVTLGEMYDYLRAQAEENREQRREGWERFKGVPRAGGRGRD